MGWNKLRRLRSQMQIVFQDPFTSLNPRFSVGQIIEEGLLVHGLAASAGERRKMISDILEEVGMDPESQNRYPHEFSGGQRQRIAIARAIIMKPRLVVLDEPTSSLDVSIQSQIINLLRDLQARHRLAYMFISHDIRVVRTLADEVVVMREGRVVEQGSSQVILEDPKHPYTRALMAAAFELETINE